MGVEFACMLARRSHDARNISFGNISRRVRRAISARPLGQFDADFGEPDKLRQLGDVHREPRVSGGDSLQQ
jgi:hypothetical protein